MFLDLFLGIQCIHRVLLGSLYCLVRLTVFGSYNIPYITKQARYLTPLYLEALIEINDMPSSGDRLEVMSHQSLYEDIAIAVDEMMDTQETPPKVNQPAIDSQHQSEVKSSQSHVFLQMTFLYTLPHKEKTVNASFSFCLLLPIVSQHRKQ